MSYGRPGTPGTSSVRWLRERLLAAGLAEDQMVPTGARPPARLAPADLEPTHYLPDVAPLVRRISRLMGGARGLSLFVTGPRGEEAARRHTALQIALGLAPMGREIVLVDSDFMRPGLGGLIDDPLADGITDMARFGRSSRSLLLKPVPEGPWLLPTGSFPEDDPAPLEPEALRSVTYRLSQVCHLALYVGPLPIRSDLHPLSRICDHVVYATVDESPETGVTCAEAVRRLQAEGAHLLGIVVYSSSQVVPTVSPEPAPAPDQQRFGPDFRYVPEPMPRRPAAPPPAPQRQAAVPPRPPAPPAPPQRQAAVPPRPPAPPAPPQRQAAVPPRPPAPPAPPQRQAAVPPRHVEPPPLRAREPAPRLPAFLEPTPEPRTTPAPSLPVPPAPPPSPEPRPAGEPKEAPTEIELPKLELPTLRDEQGPEPELRATKPEAEPATTPEDESERRVLAARIAARAPGEEPAPTAGAGGFTAGEYALEEEQGGHGSALLVIAIIVVALGFLVVLGPRILDRWRASHPSTTTQTGAAPETTAPNDREAAGQRPSAAGEHQAAPSGVPPTAASESTSSTSTDTPSSAAAPLTEPSTSVPPPATSPPPTMPPATEGAETGAASAPAQVQRGTTSPSAPAETRTTGAAAEAYGVHLASYRTLDQAEVEIKSLTARGFAARAIRTDLGERGIWYRVVAGPYATREEAEKARAELLKLPEYKYAQVRRVPRD